MYDPNLPSHSTVISYNAFISALADLAADPDSVNMVEQDIAMTASKVKDPATWAMLQLLRADVTDSVRWV